MSIAPCFNLLERLVPHLRQETARRLSQHGLRQSRIAVHLGVSQAMVSKYLRGRSTPPHDVPPELIRSMVERAVKDSIDEEGAGRVPAWCPLCPPLAGPAGAGAPVEECLRGERLPPRDETRAVLDDLEAAAAGLRRVDMRRLAPQVQVNVAMAVSGANDARGVAAFPGRLVEVAGELQPVAAPAFGASQHLADILLRVRRTHPRVRAVACLRDDATTRRALRAAGLRQQVLRRQRGDLVVRAHGTEDPDALIDPGAFGIEPITYVFGQDARDLTAKVGRISARLARRRTPTG